MKNAFRAGAAPLALLLALGCSTPGGDKGPRGDRPWHVVAPGDPIPMIQGSVEPLKVNIRGVTKNAVPVTRDNPVELSLPGDARELGFSLGAVSGFAPGPVTFTVTNGSTVLAMEKVDPGSEAGWVWVRVRTGGAALVSVTCDHLGEGAYLAHPRLIAAGEEGRGPDVFFILVDALRADALGAYGAKGNPSPHVDALAGSGARFERAYTASPFTLTSLASIFTGQYPWQHRVLFSKEAGLVFSEKVPTLVEEFQRAGYHTAAFAGTYFLLTRNGYAKGFDHFDETCTPSFFRDSAECLNQRVIPWIEEHRDEPVFVYIHYVDTHAPYYAPEPFRHRYAGGLEKPRHSDVALGEIEQFGNNRKWYQFCRSPSPSDLEYLRGLYQGEVAYVDSKIGELLGKLRPGRTLMLLTADHGEAFFEHGAMDHVADLHDPVMRVPLILSGPGVPRAMVSDAVARTVDMLPTLMDLAGIPPPADIPGRSLTPVLRGEALPTAPAPAIHFLKGKAEHALVVWPWKLFSGPARKGAPALYRLDLDPGELKDFARERPPQLEAITRILTDLQEMEPAAPGVPVRPVDEQTIKRLEALGYVK